MVIIMTISGKICETWFSRKIYSTTIAGETPLGGSTNINDTVAGATVAVAVLGIVAAIVLLNNV